MPLAQLPQSNDYEGYKMALTQLGTPYPVFTDLDGKPLDDGYLYFGEQDQNPETNPITVYYDAALTQAAAQPIRTSNGYVMRNGSPTILYADSLFSVTVRNKKRELVIYAPVSFSTSTTSLFRGPINLDDVADLVADTTLSYAVNVTAGDIVRTSAEGFAYTVAASGASDQHITTAGGVKLYASPIAEGVWNIQSFGAAGDGSTDDTTAIEIAISHISDTGGGVLEFAAKRYACTPFSLEHGVTLRGQGMAHRVFYVNEPSDRKCTVLLFTAGVGDNCIEFQGPQRGMHGIEEMSLYEIGTAAFNAIISVNGALHTSIKNVEAECLTTFNRGVGLLFARNSTSSTGSIYGVVDNFVTSTCNTGIELRDDANALSFIGGSIAGFRYALLSTKVATIPTGVSFSGTAFEGSFDETNQEIIYDDGADNVHGYIASSGVYVVPFVKLTCGLGIAFDGCYFELAGTTGTYNDGVNGVANIIAGIGLIPAAQADMNAVRIQGQLTSYLYSTSKNNVFTDSLPFQKLYSTRLPAALLLRNSTATSIPNNTATTVPFNLNASQHLNDLSRIKFAAGVATFKERGYYNIQCQVRMAASITTGAFFQLRAVINFAGGASTTLYGENFSSDQYATYYGTLLFEAGDSVEFQVFQSSGGAVSLNAAADYSFLSIVRVGA